MGNTVRVGAVQGSRTTISYRVPTPREALEQVKANLEVLAAQAVEAAGKGCTIAAFGEDTLGTIQWEAGHWDRVADLLVPAEEATLERMGQVAAEHTMNIIVCNDFAEGADVYNTAVLIGPDGREIGRYHKVNLPLHEQARTRGDGFPVFDAPGVGSIGMCICYDLVFPETTRALALAGADIVFHLTMGGASSANREASMACTKARAAENYVYLVVAWRGGNSLILGPKAETLASGKEAPGELLVADIDPTVGREAGDAHGGTTSDFRARLFRERVPSAYGMLMEETPPVLEKLKGVHVLSGREAAALSAEIFTHASVAFYEADAKFKEGRLSETKAEFTRLAERYGTTWIGRASRDRLAKIAEEEK